MVLGLSYWMGVTICSYLYTVFSMYFYICSFTLILQGLPYSVCPNTPPFFSLLFWLLHPALFHLCLVVLPFLWIYSTRVPSCLNVAFRLRPSAKQRDIGFHETRRIKVKPADLKLPVFLLIWGRIVQQGAIKVPCLKWISTAVLLIVWAKP